MIEVKGITKYYGDFKALDDVSFSVKKGEVLGFLGPNGAGKSTTMKVLTTYISASEGTASVGGFDVHVNPLEVRKRIGYLPETPPLYGDMTVEDYLLFAGQARGLGGGTLKERLDGVVSDCGLRNKLKSRIVELSKGFKQRTGLAQALIHNPDVLILDEPTSGLDPMQIVGIRKLIERLRENRCIIFSTHILQEATAVADRLVIINGGKKVADGTVDELSSKYNDIQTVRLLVKGADAKLAEPLRNIDNVQTVEMQQGPSGYGRFQLRIGGGSGAIHTACERIADMVLKGGMKLAELSPERLTLEQVFLQILKRGTFDAGPESKKEAEPELPGESKQPPADKPAPKPITEMSTIIAPTKPVKEEGDVSAQLPDDPDATAAATRMTGKPTESAHYGDKSPSETAWEAAETRADLPTDDDDNGDDFGTVHNIETDTRTASDTEFSPRLPDKDGE
ncbi:MAG: ATP-binding cassette domain-containing protein [Planctomycetes bacterium]|nr:ATP-binding cassette domain-containing protein [Planctomycetota bacterium]